MIYWKKVLPNGTILLHCQDGFRSGEDITLIPGADRDEMEWGTYSPLSDEEHQREGFEKISAEEAENLLAEYGLIE